MAALLYPRQDDLWSIDDVLEDGVNVWSCCTFVLHRLSRNGGQLSQSGTTPGWRFILAQNGRYRSVPV